MKSNRVDPRFDDLAYTVRRYYVDEFYFRHVPSLFGRVLDLSGKKVGKRGQFDISRYPHLMVTYVNLEPATRPNVCCDAAALPLAGNSFNAVICSELLEHVPDPKEVLNEAHRVLRPNGKLLLCVPFLFPIHADPYDYGRYTDHYWREALGQIGFVNTQIECQGLFWSVLIDFLKEYAAKARVSPPTRWMLKHAVALGQRWAFWTESRLSRSNSPFLRRFTTGFGIVCQK